jgi:hypothetical protein
MRPLGTVQLFTNPTTLVSGQPVDMEVVFHAGSGCPIPDKYFSIDLFGGGNYYFTKTIPINPGGDTLVHLGPLPNLTGVTNVRVDYPGDACYAPANVLFSLTNSPIPGAGGGSGGGSGGGTSPTATSVGSHATASPTTAAAAGGARLTPTPLGTNPRGAYSTNTSRNQRDGALWWVILAALVILGGAGGGVLWWWWRGTPAVPDDAPTLPPDPWS